MQKKSNFTTVISNNLFLNTINFAFIALTTTYKSLLEKTSKKYILLNKECLDKIEVRKVRKDTTLKMIKEIKEEVGPISTLVEKSITNNDIISEAKNNNFLNKEVCNYLCQKFKNFKLQDLLKLSYSLVEMERETTVSNKTLDFADYFKELFKIPTLTFNEINDVFLDIVKENANFPVSQLKNFFLEYFCFPIAIILALQSIQLADVKIEDSNLAVIEALEEFFYDINPNEELKEHAVTSNISDSPIFVERKVKSIISRDGSYKEKFNKILDIEISLSERLDIIINLNITTYENVFDYIINDVGLSDDEAITIVINSNITTYENVFNYLLTNTKLEKNIVIEKIVNSKITSYENIFNYILSLSDLKMYDKMNYILKSTIVDYNELFTYIMNYKNFSIKEKVWYSLLIPNVEFEHIFNDLLNSGEYQDEIIKNVIDMDLVPFIRLFNSILKIDGISSKQLIDYLNYYNSYANYSNVTLEEIVNYMFNIDKLTLNNQIDCIWSLLENYKIRDKEDFVLGYFNTNKYDYLELYGVTYEKLDDKQKVLLGLYEKINQEKEAYILEHYDFESKEQLDITISIVSAEGWRHYDDLYWVANTIYNRIRDTRYLYIGTNPYMQAIYPSQFVVYEKGLSKIYLNPTSISDIKQAQMAREAFNDMFYYQESKHDYVQFRAWGSKTNFQSEYVVKRGNLYGDKIRKKIDYDNFDLEDIDEEINITRKLFLTN